MGSAFIIFADNLLDVALKLIIFLSKIYTSARQITVTNINRILNRSLHIADIQ